MPLDLRHCYEILDLNEHATTDDAKKRFRHLLRQWHPDLHAQARTKRLVCEEKSKEITEAYRMLDAAIRNGSSAPPKALPRGRLEPVQVGNKWGYIDQAGFVHIPIMYQTAGHFSDGLAAVSSAEGYGYIDERGVIAIPLRFAFADQFTEGRALVQFGRFGYINRSGDWVVRPRFQAATRFNDGIAAVRLDDKWGYIKLNGDWFVLPRFEEARPFEYGRAYARLGGRTVVLNRNGAEVEARR